MPHTQITSEEKYALSLLRKQGCSQAEIARALGRHRSTISRELRRNAFRCNPRAYVPSRAQSYTHERRRRSRRNSQFSAAAWALVDAGAYDSRGRLAGKRHISTRPAGATNRSRIGHWEVDTVLGDSQAGACIVTVVERTSGFVAIGKLHRRIARNLNVRLERLVRRQQRAVRTITADNGTEFHSYKALEARLPLRFYFATPHHSWQRGSNENVNGLIRPYPPKGHSMHDLSQTDCDRIAHKLNTRPRKRYNWYTPDELYAPRRRLLHFKVDFRRLRTYVCLNGNLGTSSV